MVPPNIAMIFTEFLGQNPVVSPCLNLLVAAATCIHPVSPLTRISAWAMNAVTSSSFAPGLDGIRLPLVLFAGIRLKPEKIELLFYHLFLDAGISKDIVHDA